jgi:glycerate kinase
MNILIAPNSFKGCADSVIIAKIISSVLSNVKEYNLLIKPLSDGGDGFLSVAEFVDEVNLLTYLIKDDYRDDLKKCKILYSQKNKTIWIETAQLFGLKLFQKSELNPLQLNSELLGKLLSNINEDVSSNKIEVEQVFIGVGGTATIDFGIGACSKLGLSLLDSSNKKLEPIPMYFNEITSYHFNKPLFPFKLNCIVDVDTKLFGNPGAIEIYGKQKGASDSDLTIIKSGIENIFSLVSKDLKYEAINNLNGAGGGLAAGLNLFFNAKIIPAKDFIKDYILNDVDINKIDAVITGEGSFDYQSFEGKGTGIILKLFEEKNIPVFLINGSTNLPVNITLPKNVFIINLTDYFENVNQSIINYEWGIIQASKKVIKYLDN